MAKKYADNSYNILYTKSTDVLRLYESISTAKHLIPSLSIKDCCINFLKKEKIDEEDWPVESMIKSYQRLQNELIEEQKTK
jgi:hypothetical protein